MSFSVLVVIATLVVIVNSEPAAPNDAAVTACVDHVATTCSYETVCAAPAATAAPSEEPISEETELSDDDTSAAGTTPASEATEAATEQPTPAPTDPPTEQPTPAPVTTTTAPMQTTAARKRSVRDVPKGNLDRPQFSFGGKKPLFVRKRDAVSDAVSTIKTLFEAFSADEDVCDALSKGTGAADENCSRAMLKCIVKAANPTSGATQCKDVDEPARKKVLDAAALNCATMCSIKRCEAAVVRMENTNAASSTQITGFAVIAAAVLAVL